MHAFRVLAASAAVLASLVAARPLEGDVVIPSSAFSGGQNGAEFHSDVRVFNPTNAPVNVTPVFYDQRSGQTFTAPLQTIPARAQQSFDNILGTLFGRTLANGAFGPIRFQTSAPIIVSSGVNNVNACGTQGTSTSGQWLPGIDVGQALKAGTLVQLAASANGASGYRSNLDFMNPGATDANVTVKIHKGDGTLLSTGTITVGPNGLVQRPIDDSGTFQGVAGTTDTNLWAEFTSDQPILSFASVINNASGDPFAIVMTAEPGAGAPVASYTVSANPATGQPVTFTDTSTNSPVNRFWVFGDGAVNVPGTSVVQHIYGAAGTYKSALLVDNASGSGSALKDVVVANAGPTAVSIVATTSGGTFWTFSPTAVTLKVGQPYVITWTTPLADAQSHGMGGLEDLGIAPCSVIAAQLPCVRSFTPTASQVGLHRFFCTNTACGTAAQHGGMTATVTITP
jgi:PKD repeat protein